MINKKFVDLCNMETLEHFMLGKEPNELEYYKLYLSYSDQRVLQYLREKALNLPQRLSDVEYLELEQSRQFAVEQIRLLSSKNE